MPRAKDVNSPIYKVGNLYIPTPSSYEWTEEDVSHPDAGRTLDALMHKKTITQKVALNMAWQNVSTEIASEVLNAFTQSEYFTVEYLDVRQGGYVTKTFYLGNRTSPLYNSRLGVWSNVSFKIVER